MKQRSLIATCLTPASLSNLALFWATLIGGFGTLVLVPGPATHGLFSFPWLVVVIVSQAALAAVIVVVRMLLPDAKPITVFFTLAVSGAVRGAAVAIGAGIVGVQEITLGNLLNRSLNSAVITVIGIGLIGGTIAWREDFKQQFHVLRTRALFLERANDEGTNVDQEVLRTWTTIKVALDTTLQQASDRLAVGASPADLTDVATLLAQTVDTDLRPASRKVWPESVPESDGLRFPALFIEVMSSWRIPLPEILIFLGLIVGIGSLVRSGVVDGGLYTLRYLVITGVVLWISGRIARTWPRSAPFVAVTTLLCLPLILIAADRVIGENLLHLPEDSVGQLVVAIATPIATVFITMAVTAVRHRRETLDALQRRIDADAAVLLNRSHSSTHDAQQLSLFVHHSVQSELSAIALQLSEAASTNDVATTEAVRLAVLERLDQLAGLDPNSPPWLRSGSSVDRIATIVEAWRGMLTVTVSLPEPELCRTDQWLVAERIIEEGLANAVRHGQATSVALKGVVDDDVLVLEIVDDGIHEDRITSHANGYASPVSPGLGLQWLERIAPNDWELEREPARTCLRVRIR